MIEAAENQGIRPSYAESPPKLVGGSLCLDFLNTLSGRGDPAGPRERLTGYAELAHWAAGAGLLSTAEARRLADKARARPRQAAAALAEAKALREALMRLLSGADPGDSGLAGGSDLERLNRLLARAPTRYGLEAREGGFAWHLGAQPEPFEQPLWPVLWDAAELLTAPHRLARIRPCANPGCGWLFLDTSRNRSRRWCSMEDCGNRAKARRHYAKRKAGGGA